MSLPRTLTATKVTAAAHEDFVTATFGRDILHVPYTVAFALTRAIRMAAKLAMRAEGTPVSAWRELVKNARAHEALEDSKIRTHSHPRRSKRTANITQWSVRFEGALVYIQLDSTTLSMHYSDAFQLHTWIHNAAKYAKAWAGDRSRTITTTAYLNSAEDNYKRGVG